MMTLSRNAHTTLAFASALALTACGGSPSQGESAPQQPRSAESASPSPEVKETSRAEPRADAEGKSPAPAADQMSVDDPDPIEVPNARIVDGALTGGQPEPEELEAADSAGYGTVISLQPPSEEGAAELRDKAADLDLDYEVIPVAGAEGLSLDKAQTFAETLNEAEVEAEGDVLVHCASGNRVGAMYALKAYYAHGAATDEAIEIGERAGMTSLHDAVRDVLAADEDADD